MFLVVIPNYPDAVELVPLSGCKTHISEIKISYDLSMSLESEKCNLP